MFLHVIYVYVVRSNYGAVQNAETSLHDDVCIPQSVSSENSIFVGSYR